MTTFYPYPIIQIEETDSTNNYLKSLSDKEEVEEYTVVTSQFQNAGKGQRGNSWESDKGKNLLFSILLRPSFLRVRDQFILSQIISLSVKAELDNYVTNISIKWPNDIYWKQKKICGILIENTIQGDHIEKSIIGVGINVNQETFISNAPNPVSLRQITNEEYDYNILLKGILNRLISYYNEIKTHGCISIKSHYKDSLFRKEGFFRYRDKDEEFTAQILDIDSTGTLFLEDKNGRLRKYLFKEVSFIL